MVLKSIASEKKKLMKKIKASLAKPFDVRVKVQDILKLDVPMTADVLLGVIKDRQLHARNLIKTKLELDTLGTNFMNITNKGIGQTAYKNYIWLPVVIEGCVYWISMFANDVDSKTGNVHTRTGCIQFWKGIFKNGCGSPNEIECDNKDRTLVQIHYPAVVNSKKYDLSRKAQLSRQTIDSIKTLEDIQKVANEFYDFLLKDSVLSKEVKKEIRKIKKVSKENILTMQLQ